MAEQQCIKIKLLCVNGKGNHQFQGSRHHMSAVLSPIVSEFETEEQAASHDRWFRAQVQASLDDPRPSIPHDQVMAEMDALIAEAEKRHQQ